MFLIELHHSLRSFGHDGLGVIHVEIEVMHIAGTQTLRVVDGDTTSSSVTVVVK